MLQVCAIVTIAPELVLEMVEPRAELARALGSRTFDELCMVDGEMVKVTVATTPPEIAVWFMPSTKQVEAPAILLQ